MAFTPIATLENPSKAIVPHPCTQAAEDRNTDAVRRILTKHYKEIKKIGTRLASAVVSRGEDDGCCQRLTLISGFELWGEDDPDDPIEVPTEADNFFTIGLRNGVKVLLGYNPNANDGFSPWKVVQTDQACFTAVSDLTYADHAFSVTDRVISAPICGNDASRVLFNTTDADVIRLLEWDAEACALKSKPSTLEVFAKSESDTAETELTFSEEIHLLGDVYQKVDGNIYGYYTAVKVACADTPYEELLITTADCQE